MMSERPEGWENPLLQQDEKGDFVNSRVFEAGADAMLEGLKKGGVPVSEVEKWYDHKDMYEHLKYRVAIGEQCGTLVFIPE